MSAARAAVALSIYALTVFALAGTAAPPLLTALRTLGVHGPVLHELTADLLKAFALVGLWPLLAWTGTASAQRFGLRCSAHGWLALRRGLLLGLLSMALVAALLLLAGVRVLRPEFGFLDLPAVAMKAAVVAVPVAVLEEIWFRGALTSVARPIGPRRSLALIAVLYATVHFIRPDLAVPAPYVWSDGFVALSGMFGRLADWDNIDGFVALLMAGLVLGQLRRATGCVAACIGMHAGWVFVIQVLRRTTRPDPEADAAWIVSRYDGTIGWAFAALSLMLLLILVRGARAAHQARRASTPLER